MSDFTSDFWSIYVSVITVVSNNPVARKRRDRNIDKVFLESLVVNETQRTPRISLHCAHGRPERGRLVVPEQRKPATAARYRVFSDMCH